MVGLGIAPLSARLIAVIEPMPIKISTSSLCKSSLIFLLISGSEKFEIRLNSVLNNIGYLLPDKTIISFLISSTMPNEKSPGSYFDNIANEYGFQYEVVPLSIDSINFNNYFNNDIDAIYTGLLFDFSSDQIENIYKAANQKKIPSFALGGQGYVELGAMASITAEDVEKRLSRRTSLNIEKILEGKNPRKIPVILNYSQSLVLNQHTMNMVGYYPNWEVLSEAQIIESESNEDLEILDFIGVINEALGSNLVLKVAELELESSSKETKFAQSNLLPQIDIGATGVLIDKYRAASSMGQNPERSAYGSASLSQLLYSEKAFANVKIQQHFYESMEYSYQSTEMDIVQDVATVFMNILQAISMESIARENLKATRKNLEIARMRADVGYSGMSDVYRWESKLSSDKIELLSANENRRLAEYALMQMLNRPFDKKFALNAVDIKDTSLFVMSDANISKYVDNFQYKDMFRNFLVEEAMASLPELKQLEAAIAAQERYLKATKRTHFIPDIGVSAQANYDFYKGGEGSTIEPVELQLDPTQPPITIDMFEEPKEFSWNVGVNASLPISQGGRLHYDRQQATIDLLKLQEDRENIRKKLSQQVISIFERASLSYPKIKLSANAAEYAMKSYEIVQDSYSHGLVSITQLLDAQQAAVQANLYASVSIYTYLIDVLNLQRAIGQYFILAQYEDRANFFYRLDQSIENQKNTNQQ